MVIYCQSCGNPNKHGSQKPKFCQNCGNSLSSHAKTQKNNPRPMKRRSQTLANEEEPEETDVLQVPSLESLDVEIDIRPNKGIKFEDAIGTLNPETRESTQMDNPQSESLSNEEFLKQFQKEAGAIREK